MEVKSAFFCDAANLEVSGKLNVLGIFDNIYAPQFPFVHHQCIFVAKIQGEPTEVGRHQLTITFEDSEGNQILPAFKDVFEFPQGNPSHYCLIAMNGITYPSPGIYSTNIIVDDELLRKEIIVVEHVQ